MVTFANGANPFIGYYSDGQFIEQKPHEETNSDAKTEACCTNVYSVVSLFPSNKNLSGITQDGQVVDVVIEKINDFPMGIADTWFDVKIIPSAERDAEIKVLFGTPDMKVRYLQPLTVYLNAQIERELRQKAIDLWKLALEKRSADERAKKITFSNPVVQSAKGTENIVTVYFPAVEEHSPGYVDDRASAFFIYNIKDKRILFSTFGHPEWSPGSEQVITVKPLIFFTVNDGSNIYFMGNYSYGWEHIGFAIFDLKTGKALLKSFD